MNVQHKLVAALSMCTAITVPNTASAVAINGQGTWETTLQGRDLDGDLSTFEAYYDTVLDITWLADASYVQTSHYDADGRLTWSVANAWVASLDFNGITGWRLPTTVDLGNNGCSYTNFYQGVDCAYNITTHSEMSHMFYITLGNKAYYTTSGSGPQADWDKPNTGPFSNFRRLNYWSATEYAPNTSDAWQFFLGDGFQFFEVKSASGNAWAVHAGDIGAIPIPSSLILFFSGLFGLIGLNKAARHKLNYHSVDALICKTAN